jgi:hypothetical protein
MMMMTTTMLNDLAIAVVTDKNHADKLISILYKKKMSISGKMKIELLTYVLVRSICLDRMCVSESEYIDADEMKKKSRRKSFQRKRVTMSSIV